MSAERVQPLDFDREDCEDHVWHLVHNIQSTPALNQKWKDTEGRSRLLTFLKIDPKNVVSFSFSKEYVPLIIGCFLVKVTYLLIIRLFIFSYQNEFSVMPKPSKPSSSLSNIPAFASGLGATLEPLKVETKVVQVKEPKKEEESTIPPKSSGKKASVILMEVFYISQSVLLYFSSNECPTSLYLFELVFH